MLEQIKKAKHIVDILSKDELYVEIKATLRSTNQLSTFVGTRGSESKLEKGHHAINHFANTGMRHTLADFLGMAGIAAYNLRIRYRFKVAQMPPSKRAEIPVAFQNAPGFTNHLRLSRNNGLGREAGLVHDVHKGVEILPADNGERFFYEYYQQQKHRQEIDVGYSKTNRCLCRDCGKSNPYKKRNRMWDKQEDLLPLTAAATPTPKPLLLAPSPLAPVTPSPPPLLHGGLQPHLVGWQYHLSQQQHRHQPYSLLAGTKLKRGRKPKKKTD